MSRRCFRGLLGLLLMLAAPVPPALAESITDARNRVVSVDDRSRVVAIGGTITEMLYDLGQQDHLVGIDSSSVWPPEALATKPNVGYVRALAAEGVLSLHPSLIVIANDAGPPAVIESLMAAGIPLVFVDATPDRAAVAARLRFIGRVMGVEAQAESQAAAVDAGFAALDQLPPPAHPPRLLFVLSASGGRLMAAGRGTAADAVIKLAGGVNAMAGFDGYKPVGDEALLTAAPDAVLTMNNGAPITADQLFTSAAWQATPAGQARRLITVDGLALLGFGPRTPAAARDLRAQLDRLTAPNP